MPSTVTDLLASARITSCLEFCATIFSRTYDSGQTLETRVVSTWGAPHAQSPPVASYEHIEPKTTETIENGKKKTLTEKVTLTDYLPIESSRKATIRRSRSLCRSNKLRSAA